MPTATQYRHEDVATVPRGFRVRTVTAGGHKVRIAFPPGPRKKGSGRLVAILHPKAENPKRCKEKNRIRKLGVRSQKNQNGNGAARSTAAAMYEDFHGRAPSEILTLQEALMTSGDYTALGDMGSLWLEPVKGREPNEWPAPDIEFEKSDKVKLATDAKGQQLYLVGGNQKLPLDYLEKHGVSTDKRFISLGEVYGISYLTNKSFDGFRESEYAHEFGEQTGERPFAFYDAELKRIVLVGGAYSIAAVDDALGASPGIVN